jgi:hypothetical protein
MGEPGMADVAPEQEMPDGAMREPEHPDERDEMPSGEMERDA